MSWGWSTEGRGCFLKMRFDIFSKPLRYVYNSLTAYLYLRWQKKRKFSLSQTDTGTQRDASAKYPFGRIVASWRWGSMLRCTCRILALLVFISVERGGSLCFPKLSVKVFRCKSVDWSTIILHSYFSNNDFPSYMSSVTIQSYQCSISKWTFNFLLNRRVTWGQVVTNWIFWRHYIASN